MLIVVFVLLTIGLIAGISSYFIMNQSDKVSKQQNCEINNDDECLDITCNERCSQCKNYRVSTDVTKIIDEKYENETCVLPEDRQCVLEGWCQAELRPGS